MLEVGSYLLAEAFLSKCLSVLAGELSSTNCWSYLSLAREICCEELKMTVFTYLSRNLLETPNLIKYAAPYSVLDVKYLECKKICHMLVSCL